MPGCPQAGPLAITARLSTLPPPPERLDGAGGGGGEELSGHDAAHVLQLCGCLGLPGKGQALGLNAPVPWKPPGRFRSVCLGVGGGVPSSSRKHRRLLSRASALGSASQSIVCISIYRFIYLSFFLSFFSSHFYLALSPHIARLRAAHNKLQYKFN